MALLEVGPISVSIHASPIDFYYYSGGIYDNPSCKNGRLDLDHSVVLVGYGRGARGKDYWIIKNSWSAHWGERGFVRIAKADNLCGVATSPVFALLD